MITPHQFLHLDNSVLNQAKMIIEILKKEGTMKRKVLLKKIMLAIGEDADLVFPYAADFLYLLGKINYKESLDTITLLHHDPQLPESV